MRSFPAAVCVALIVALSIIALEVRAAFNVPISFSQAGTVTITLDESRGGFDHILEESSAAGPVVAPIFALTDLGAPSGDVLGYPPAAAGATSLLGSFGAGEEIGFRLTNVESFRLGTPGTLATQIFSGSASTLNPNPGDYYTLVSVVDPLTIRVYWEDAFPTSPNDPDPETTFLTANGGYDAAFTLTLVPVPEPGTAALLLVAGSIVGLRRFGRRERALDPQ